MELTIENVLIFPEEIQSGLLQLAKLPYLNGNLFYQYGNDEVRVDLRFRYGMSFSIILDPKHPNMVYATRYLYASHKWNYTRYGIQDIIALILEYLDWLMP